MGTSLENLANLVADHRRVKKRGKYPSSVWDSVSALRARHSVEEIAKATGITRAQIYRQIKSKRARFQEVKLIAPPAPISAKAVGVELRRSDGAELRFRVEASAQELSTLLVEFLR